MHTHVTCDAFELECQLHQLGNFFLALNAIIKLRFLFDRLCECDTELIGNQFGNTINVVVAHAENTPHITDHSLGGHRTEGGNLRHRIVAVFVLYIIDDTITAFLTKVDIKVGHRNTFGVKKTLEQQVIVQRIKVGNAQ